MHRGLRRHAEVRRRGALRSDRRAAQTARSVPYNIAEGHKRPSTADFLRFLGIAAGSGGELETQLLLAERLAYLTQDPARDLLERCREVERMLPGLVRSLGRR